MLERLYHLKMAILQLLVIVICEQFHLVETKYVEKSPRRPAHPLLVRGRAAHLLDDQARAAQAPAPLLQSSMLLELKQRSAAARARPARARARV